MAGIPAHALHRGRCGEELDAPVCYVVVCAVYGCVGRRVVEGGVVESMTNADFIRSMSDYELAEMLDLISCGMGPEGVKTAEDWRAWVRKEYGNGEPAPEPTSTFYDLLYEEGGANTT